MIALPLLCPTEKVLFIKRKSDMEKVSSVLLFVWMVLAVASFVASFWAPLFFKVLGLVFGGFNMLTILSWTISTIQERNRNKAKEE